MEREAKNVAGNTFYGSGAFFSPIFQKRKDVPYLSMGDFRVLERPHHRSNFRVETFYFFPDPAIGRTPETFGTFYELEGSVGGALKLSNARCKKLGRGEDTGSSESSLDGIEIGTFCCFIDGLPDGFQFQVLSEKQG